MLVSRPGGLVRLMPGARPADGHIFPLTHPFVFDQVMGAMSYFDQLTQTRTGISQVFNGVDANVINKTASGQAMLATQSAQRVEQIARMFAVGVEYLFSCVLELIQKHANKTQTFQMRGTWYAVDPQAWVRKRDLKISVGVGAGNKDAMLMQLQQMFAAQLQTMPLGISNPQTVYQTATEIAKLQGFSQPEKFWNDPSKNPPPPPQPPLPLMIEQMKMQGEAQKTQFEAQADSQKTQQEMAFERWKAEQDIALEQWKAQLDSQTKIAIEQMKAGTTKEVKAAELMSTHQLKGAEFERADNEVAQESGEKQAVQQQMQAVEQAVSQLSQMLAGRQTVAVEKVRDKTGRMVGAVIRRADGSTEQVTIQ